MELKWHQGNTMESEGNVSWELHEVKRRGNTKIVAWVWFRGAGYWERSMSLKDEWHPLPDWTDVDNPPLEYVEALWRLMN